MSAAQSGEGFVPRFAFCRFVIERSAFSILFPMLFTSLRSFLALGFHERLVDEPARLRDLAAERIRQLGARAALRREPGQQTGDAGEPGLVAARDVELRQIVRVESDGVVRQLLARKGIPGEGLGGGLSLARVDGANGEGKVQGESGVLRNGRQVDVLRVRRLQLRAVEAVRPLAAGRAVPLPAGGPVDDLRLRRTWSLP